MRPTDSPSPGMANIRAHDRDWQFPAITEQHAFHRLCASGGAPGGVIYVAYPWATLIDKLQCNAADAPAHLAAFRAFARSLPHGLPKVTVCQHILMRQYLHLFAQAGITEIFWSHATQADAAASPDVTPRLHPFPLYPVQVPAAPLAQDAAPRRHLFSFVGAKASEWYMTRVRDWILRDLADDPRGLVLGREAWHFHRVVYDQQIRALADADAGTAQADAQAGAEFAALLRDSLFALCPSGTGPNSIRLWEAIGAGAIPVILSDHWAPPGDAGLWQRAAVFCAETQEALRALPDRLEALARDPDRLAQMRDAGRQLWLLYGPGGFIADLQARLLALAGGPAPLYRPQPPSDALERAAAALLAEPEEEAAALFLLSAASLLLTEAAAAEVRLAPQGAVGQALALARGTLPPGHPALLHFDLVAAGARPLAAPFLNGSAVPALCVLSAPGAPTPLGHAALRRMAGSRVRFVAKPAAADLVVTGGWPLPAGDADLSAGRPLVLMPETALPPDLPAGPAFHPIAPEAAGLLAFDRLPYALLTDDRLPARLCALLARPLPPAPATVAFADPAPQGWQHDLAALLGDGLRLAPDPLPPDQQLDRMMRLYAGCRAVVLADGSADSPLPPLLFEALAAGVPPAARFLPQAALRRLWPAGAVLDLGGHTPAEAAALLAAPPPDGALQAARTSLLALLCDGDALLAERRRVVACVLDALEDLL